MEIILVLVVLAIVAVGLGWFLTQRRGAGAGAERPRIPPVGGGDPPSGEAAPREPTLETLRPGDAISFWDGENNLVEAVVECVESLGGRTTIWRWNLLSRDRVLETAPDGNVLYTRSKVVYQGSELFHQLTAEPEEGGVLKTFEARVRAGTVAREPVQFLDDNGLAYQVRSTGTFTLAKGAPPAREVWRDISSNPGDNVYFELDRGDGVQVLGIWTSHILLLYGRELTSSDIQGLYPGGE